MTVYTVTSVSDNTHDWNGKGGAMRSYRVDLRGPDGQETKNVEWARKLDSAPPTVNQEVDCTVDLREGNKFGPKLTMTPRGGSGGYGGRVKSPEEIAADAAREAAKQRMIVRQHSQTTAMRWAELQQARGLLPAKIEKADDLKPLIDFFYDDAMSAGADAPK